MGLVWYDYARKVLPEVVNTVDPEGEKRVVDLSFITRGSIESVGIELLNGQVGCRVL